MYEKYFASIETIKDRFKLKKIIEKILNDPLYSENKEKEAKIDKIILINKARNKLRNFYKEAIVNAKTKKELEKIADEIKVDKTIKRKGSLIGIAMLRRFEKGKSNK